jgi:hypothetical protein
MQAGQRRLLRLHDKNPVYNIQPTSNKLAFLLIVSSMGGVENLSKSRPTSLIDASQSRLTRVFLTTTIRRQLDL